VTASQQLPAVEVDDEPRPDESDRYAIYVATARNRRRLAETSLNGIGLCLRTLRDEGQITNDSRVGILDRLDHLWLVNPWAKGDR
jgi:hypothetical protein